jgi:hypothetical protein
MCQTPCEPERTPNALPESTHSGPETRTNPQALPEGAQRAVRTRQPAITDLQHWIDLNA